MNACTSADQSPETWLEVRPLEGLERAACFVSFLLQAIPRAELGFGPREGDCYRFNLAAPPSTIIRALLESTEFTPVALRALESGELQVTLQHGGHGLNSEGQEELVPSQQPVAGDEANEENSEESSTADEDEGELSAPWTPIAAEDIFVEAEPCQAEPSQADAGPPLVGALEQLDSAIGELLQQLTVETAMRGPNEAGVVELERAEPSDSPNDAPLENRGARSEEPAAERAVEAEEREEETQTPVVEAEPAEAGDAEKRYHIIVGDDCPVCRAVSRISFTADRPPELPIAGCRATDGCGCGLPEFEPETGQAAGSSSSEDSERPLAFHGLIQLVAHPFGNFGRLNQFITMVGGLPGVRSVTLRRFRNGILRLAVDYTGTAPLSTHLKTAMEIPLEVLSDGGDLIEIAVADDGRGRQPSLELVSMAARGANQRRPASA